MKLLLLFFSAFLPLGANASIADMPNHIAPDYKLPASSITIMSAAELNEGAKIPESISNQSLLNIQQQKEKGYIQSHDKDAKNLLSMSLSKNILALNRGVKISTNSDAPELKKNIEEIQLAFKYSGIPGVSEKNIIGFSAVGMWLEGKGWTGIKEVFTDKNLGTCSLSLYNIEISHGSVKMDESTVRYDVNHKPGVVNVHGSDEAGYMYIVNWNDVRFIHDLECANFNFDKNITDRMIAYAIFIDNALST